MVKRIHAVTERLDLPLLWWHEAPPSDAVVAEVGAYVAGVLTSWTDEAAVPGWLWGVGAGIDLGVPLIETFPARPPLRLLAWAPTGKPDLNRALQTIDVLTGAATTAINQRSDVCAVPAAAVVAEAMVALVLAEAATEKFGGDSVTEIRRNVAGYLDNLLIR